jgi:arginine decarboxylase
MLDCLQMLHYHLGLADPQHPHIRAAIARGRRIYVDLVREGAPWACSTSAAAWRSTTTARTPTSPAAATTTSRNTAPTSSRASCSICSTRRACPPHDRQRVRPRHRRLLLGAALQHPRRHRFESHEPPSRCRRRPEPLRNLRKSANADAKNLQECYHDAVYYRDEIRESAFNHGDITLRERALAEQIFWHIVDASPRGCRAEVRARGTAEGLETAWPTSTTATSACSSRCPTPGPSTSSSPIMPIHRLNERPARLGPSWPTSPATATARSTGSSTCTT